MPPKQMFKVRRSANDQIRVVFQVTSVTAQLLQTIMWLLHFSVAFCHFLSRPFFTHLFHISGCYRSRVTLYPTDKRSKREGEKVKNEPKGRNTNVPSWDWGVGTFPLNRMERIEFQRCVYTGRLHMHAVTKKEQTGHQNPSPCSENTQLHSYPQIHVPQKQLPLFPFSPLFPLVLFLSKASELPDW